MSDKPDPLKKLFSDMGSVFVKALKAKLNESHDARDATSAPRAITMDSVELRRRVGVWSRASGVGVRWPEEYIRDPSVKDLTKAYDIHQSPCVDFGKLSEQVPGFELRPESTEQLCASLRFLSQERIPIKIRGGNHSSGGQTLIRDGAVIDIRGLSGIIEDAPERGEVCARAGMTWMALCDHLQKQGRRPIVLTGHWLTTISGTLAVGGYGDTSHNHGPQIGMVTQMVVVTLDGARHSVSPGDPLFDYTMAGRGQLGVIAEVTLQTMKSDRQLAARVMRWSDDEAFIKDAIKVIDEEKFDLFLARYFWKNEGHYVAGAGHFQSELCDVSEFEGLSGELVDTQFADIYQTVIDESVPDRGADRYWPALEFVLPLPDGLDVWRQFIRGIKQPLLHLALEEGTPVMVLRRDDRFPLAAYPDSDYCLLVAVRPRILGFQIPGAMQDLSRLRKMVLDAGGKIYLMSIESPDAIQPEKQFGEEACATLLALKKKYDPHWLLNPGLLPTPET